MSAGRIDIAGVDMRLAGAREERKPIADACSKLAAWAARYDVAEKKTDPRDLVAIGREMFAWLDEDGWASDWQREGDYSLEIAVDGHDDDFEKALLDAPWELLHDARDWLASDEVTPLVVWRRIGRSVEPTPPAAGHLRVIFMASAPEGEQALNYEREEARIIAATKDSRRVDLVVEETGALDQLGQRMSSPEGPFEGARTRLSRLCERWCARPQTSSVGTDRCTTTPPSTSPPRSTRRS